MVKFYKVFILIIMTILMSFCAFSISPPYLISADETINEQLSGTIFSEIIWQMSQDIINNETELILLTIKPSGRLNDPTTYKVYIASNDYANQTGFNCDDSGCSVMGNYEREGNKIYILPETISEYYPNATQEDIYAKIRNTYIHELNHYFQYNIGGYFDDMSESLDLNYTELTEFTTTLHNPEDFYDLNLSGIPAIVNETVDFPSVLFSYNENKYTHEIMVRIAAICYSENENYTNYWEMIDPLNYSLCQNYTFPVYLDEKISEHVALLTEAYFEQYLGINLRFELEESIETMNEGFDLIGTIVDEFNSFLQNNIISVIVVLGLASFISFMIAGVLAINKYILNNHKLFK